MAANKGSFKYNKGIQDHIDNTNNFFRALKEEDKWVNWAHISDSRIQTMRAFLLILTFFLLLILIMVMTRGYCPCANIQHVYVVSG